MLSNYLVSTGCPFGQLLDHPAHHASQTHFFIRNFECCSSSTLFIFSSLLKTDYLLPSDISSFAAERETSCLICGTLSMTFCISSQKKIGWKSSKLQYLFGVHSFQVLFFSFLATQLIHIAVNFQFFPRHQSLQVAEIKYGMNHGNSKFRAHISPCNFSHFFLSISIPLQSYGNIVIAFQASKAANKASGRLRTELARDSVWIKHEVCLSCWPLFVGFSFFCIVGVASFIDGAHETFHLDLGMQIPAHFPKWIIPFL